jgi:glycosyltransferase involved in cell wall biosynthesis
MNDVERRPAAADTLRMALVITNLRGGGAEKALLRLAALLHDRGHEVHIVLLEHVIDHTVEPGLQLHALTAPGVPARKGVLGKALAARRLRRMLISLAGERGFDLVISMLPFADEVTARAGCGPLWHMIENTLSAELERLAPAKARRRLRRYRKLYGAANLIAVSDGVAADLRETLRFDRAHIVRIYNPFDLEAIRALARAPADDRPGVPYVIHVGRFNRQKRHDVLFDAWRRLAVPEKLVLLVHPEPALTALIRQFGLEQRVELAGFQENPFPWIAGARLLVLSSDHEGLGNVLIEALACGTPVVSTDCPSGPREILGPKLAQWLVPPGDGAALARTIERALHTPPDVADARLERFDARTVAGQIEALCRPPRTDDDRL